jgi:hypothetical protein
VKVLEGISVDERREKIVKKLEEAQNETLVELKYFDSQVPHWFLSPWYPRTERAGIYKASKEFVNKSLYALHDEYILINPEWYGYLFDNISLLKAFCYWNLAIFLQARNPNVPDIPNKLIRPAVRNSLMKQRREFWDIVFATQGPLECIYTHKKLDLGSYAVEHFIPYAFVSHDLIWNLIPADKLFNSSKGDRIPRFEKYFKPFVDLQLKGLETVREVKPENKYLQEYLTIFPDLPEIRSLSDNFVKQRFKQVIQPLVTIALNNGFEYMS